MAGRLSLEKPDPVSKAVAALHRHPEYADVFPIGVALADWAVAGA